MSDPSGPTGEGGTTTCERIVTAVADTKGVDATTLPPLYDVVDPECLNRIFDPTARGNARAGGTITFRWAGCRVTVEGPDVDVTVETTVSAASGTAAASERCEGGLD